MLLNINIPRRPRGDWNRDRGISRRRQILQALDVPLTIHEIAARTELAPKNLAAHLRRLTVAGAVIQIRQGHQVFYTQPTP